MKQAIKILSESIEKKYNDSREQVLLRLNHLMNLCFYDLGKKLSESRKKTEHDSEFYETLSNELIRKTHRKLIFSVDSLKDYEHFYDLYQNYYSYVPFDYNKAMDGTFVGESLYKIISLPWSFNKRIINKCKDVHEAFFYVEEAYYCDWTEKELIEHIEKNSYKDPNYKVDTTGRSIFDYSFGDK